MADWTTMINNQNIGFSNKDMNEWGNLSGFTPDPMSWQDRMSSWGNQAIGLFKPGIDPKTGSPIQSQFQGYLGNAQTAFGLGKTAFDIMGAMKYGKYVDTQRKALDQQMKVARAQMGGYYENQAARRAANSGMGTTEALAQGKQVSEEQMMRWGL